MTKKRNAPGSVLELRLYIAGQTPRSMAALSNLKAICHEHLDGNYRIEVVDLLKNPMLARGHQILAIPTLVRSLPVPIRRIIGDLSDTTKVLIGLDIQESPVQKRPPKDRGAKAHPASTPRAGARTKFTG